ncbi:MAG: GWxTD domain-containing protein [Rhodothermaceae bacterium]|nr:GWxTD domain-containing protein [Rhodothermaceae bacterium]MYF62937.1 GWxTD domain-containing protein [Rhodothermaceae bacterium]MYI84877.1 GWxTD domain-containing protein [Rhodothermaceae bacterium]
MIRVLSIIGLQLLAVWPLLAQEANIARVFTEENVQLYAEAATSYLDWLGKAADAKVEDKEALVRHLHWIALITPKESPINQSVQALISDQGTSDDATAIVSWWHQQDPLPATLYNERVEEHLYRVYHAQREYAHQRDPLGVDDRGRIFVRLGRPWREAVISLQNPRLMTLPLEFRLPRNEIWVYRNIHDDAHYLFVQLSRRRPFRIDTPDALIPLNLRGPRNVPTLLAWMEDIFGQLAMEHPHYGAVYDAVANYTTLPTSEPLRPYQFSQMAIQDTRTRDDQHQLSRARTVPNSVSQVYGNALKFEPQTRFIRFLEQDGSTRLEAYWDIDLSAVRPSRTMIRRSRQLKQATSSDFILSVALSKRDERYEPEEIRIRRYHLPRGAAQESPVQSWIVPNFSSVSPVAMQWSLHWTVPDSVPPQPGTVWAIGTASIDTLEALQGNGASLEVSDLKPLFLESPKNFDDALPYMGKTISASTPLALYFEAYFLRFDEQDRTNYTVSYSLSGEGKQPITAYFESEGQSSTIREFVEVDIERWANPGPFTLTLTINDKVAGTSVSRHLELEFER